MAIKMVRPNINCISKSKIQFDMVRKGFNNYYHYISIVICSHLLYCFNWYIILYSVEFHLDIFDLNVKLSFWVSYHRLSQKRCAVTKSISNKIGNGYLLFFCCCGIRSNKQLTSNLSEKQTIENGKSFPRKWMIKVYERSVIKFKHE